MADSPASTTGAAPGESPAQTKARLRRERLAAKSGASRLQQITALQGGPPKDASEFEKDVPVKPSSTPSQRTPAVSGTATPDPDEIDISQHHYTPASQPRLPSPFAFDGNPAGAFAPGQAPDAAQDPMMAMMQQMLGGGAGAFPAMPGDPGQPGAGPANLPPGLANLFSTMNGGGAAAAEPSPEQSSAWIWRLVHSAFSLGLAIYIVLHTPFTGSKLSRDNVLEDDWTAQSTPAQNFAHFFYLFATFEVVLQSSRYFVEKGQLQGSGILSTVAGILPAPYSGYVRTIGRYSVIYSTIVSDAMVVVFVLGATSWWRGAAVA
ncbi:Nn.00g091450.m01.CDS01 [Neocucurbitaria sp. VM-36]